MKFLLKALTLVMLAFPVYSQDVAKTSQHGDWEVYLDNDLCWASTMPALDRSVYKRNGKRIDPPNRGDKKFISFFVAYKKGKTPSPNVVYSAGNFEFSESPSNANLFKLVVKGRNIKDKSFVLGPRNQNNMGWAYPAELQEPDIVELMKKAGNAKVTVVSKRGTVITDTMSLIGITAALKVAKDKCTTK